MTSPHFPSAPPPALASPQEEKKETASSSPSSMSNLSNLSKVALAGLALFCGAALLSLTLSSPWLYPKLAFVLLLAALSGGALAFHFCKHLPFRVAAVALTVTHFAALFAFPVWSDDLYRYVYEGRAMRAGWSTPYAVSPLFGERFVHDDVQERVNHPEISASYPPFWQVTGFVLAHLGDALRTPFFPFRLFFVLCNLAVGWLLLRNRGRRSYFFWMLHPLPFIELSHGAHLDALGVLLFLMSVLLVRMNPFVRGVLCGFAFGIKPIAAAALFALPKTQKMWTSPPESNSATSSSSKKRSHRRKVLLPFLLGLFMGVAAPALPFLMVDAPLLKGLSEYGKRWEAQPTGFALLKWPLSSSFEKRAQQNLYAHLHISRSPFGVLLEDGGREIAVFAQGKTVAHPLLVDDRLIARGLAVLVIGLAYLWLLRKRPPTSERTAWVLLWFFAFAPTVHPWYLLWPLALLASSRRRGRLELGIWWAAALAPLAYQAVIQFRLEGLWQEALWPRIIVVAAFFVQWLMVKRSSVQKEIRLEKAERDLGATASSNDAAAQ